LQIVDKQPLGIKGKEGIDWEWREISGKRKKVSLWTGHDYYFEQQFEEHKPESLERVKGKWNGHREPMSSYVGMDISKMCGPQGRNKRCVWTIPTMPCSEAHFAVYPEKLIETPIKAGCPEFICKKCGKAREKVWEQGERISISEPEARKSWDKIGVVLALFAALCWATATVILQIGLVGANPIDANLIRITVGSAFLLPIFLFARKRGMPKPTKRATKFVLVAGFFGMGIGSIMYVSTVAITGAAVTSVIAASAPLFALPLAIFYLKEKITPLILIGTMCTVLGIWLVVLGF